MYNTRANYYDIFIENRFFSQLPRDMVYLGINYELRDLLIACYNTENYDKPYEINEFDGELPSFKKSYEVLNNKTSKKKIGTSKSIKWYYHPICVVIMGYFIGVREATDPNIDWHQRSEIALKKIRDLLEPYPDVKKVNGIKILYRDPRKTNEYYRYAFNCQRYPELERDVSIMN